MQIGCTFELSGFRSSTYFYSFVPEYKNEIVTVKSEPADFPEEYNKFLLEQKISRIARDERKASRGRRKEARIQLKTARMESYYYRDERL